MEGQASGYIAADVVPGEGECGHTTVCGLAILGFLDNDFLTDRAQDKHAVLRQTNIKLLVGLVDIDLALIAIEQRQRVRHIFRVQSLLADKKFTGLVADPIAAHFRW